jgi:hypothetical protein
MSSAEYHHNGQTHRKKEGGPPDKFGQTHDMQKARAEALAEKE